MKMKPISKKRIYHDIIKQIKYAIENEQIKPGQRLPSERHLAKTLSVSRTSVKEAISVLDSSGVVSIKPGVGVFLKDDGTRDILFKINIILKESINLVEILEFRQAVEGDAAYYAALRGTGTDRHVIAKSFIALEGAVHRKEIAAREDYQFHTAVCMAAKNFLLQKVTFLISDTLLDSLNESRSRSLKIPGKSEEVLEEHRRIHDAIHNGDADAARYEMWDHLQRVKERFL